jgi:hypothetical protein
LEGWKNAGCTQEADAYDGLHSKHWTSIATSPRLELHPDCAPNSIGLMAYTRKLNAWRQF